MLEIDILEGARGTGKSTLAFKIRQRIPETTLINFTGFHTDGEEGLWKVVDYYDSFLKMIYAMREHQSSFVFDRFFFTEAIFSQLYKEYYFMDDYDAFAFELGRISRYGVKVNIFFLTINDEEELKQRLNRDKVPFGKVEESVKETMKQQEVYAHLFGRLNFDNDFNKHLNVWTVDTSNKTNEEVYDEIMKIKENL